MPASTAMMATTERISSNVNARVVLFLIMTEMIMEYGQDVNVGLRLD